MDAPLLLPAAAHAAALAATAFAAVHRTAPRYRVPCMPGAELPAGWCSATDERGRLYY